MATPELALWHHAQTCLSHAKFDEARAAFEQLSRHIDWKVVANLQLSQLALRQGFLKEAVSTILRAAAEAQDEAALAAAVVKQCFDVGEIEAGLRVVQELVVQESFEPDTLMEVARSLCDQSFPGSALPLLERAAALGDRSPRLFYLLALARMFAGDLLAAEASFEQCIRLQPDNAAAHYMLAGLRHQTAAHHHVPRLRDALARTPQDHPNGPLLYYALFKELDDLGDTEAAWSALASGMTRRRAQVGWNAERDKALFAALHQIGRSVETKASTPLPGPAPIFVVGLPRSGTTLLERMLSGHPDVTDAGELRDFTFQARCWTGQMGAPETDLALANALAGCKDWVQLGQRYLEHTQWRANSRRFFTDKLPINYLNVGWIAKALPHAKILHMVRDPMDVCFSNLKQLFAPGNGYSFDQLEMADHYARYRELMSHWHREFPGRILDVEYRDLVTQPESTARNMLAFCGLSWVPQVVSIEGRQGAVATASMVQVREAVHTRFLGQWRRYAKQLKPMQQRLAEAGW